MKKYALILTIITLGIFFSVYSYSNNLETMDIRSFFKEKFSKPEGGFSYTELWTEVQNLQSKNKKNEAYKKVKEILAKAKKEKNYPQLIKTYIYSLDYQNETVDDGFYPELEKMEKEINDFPEADKAVMHSVIGQIYMNYLKREYYAISKRTDVDVKDGNVKTYSTAQLLRTAKSHFLESVKPEKELKEKKLADYKDIIKGLRPDEELWPTLYDLVLNRALIHFFENDISRYEVFDDEFDFNNETLLAPADEFLKLKLDEKELENSASYQAFLIHQNLLKAHLEGEDNVLVYNDLNRLHHYLGRMMSEEKNALYLETLLKMENKYSDKNCLIKIKWEVAKFYERQGEKTKAHKKAEEILELSPENSNAKNLILNIESKEVDADGENYIPSTKEIVLNLSHRNTDKIYLKFGKISKKFYDRPEFNKTNYLDKFSSAMSDVQTFIHSVEKKADYTSSESEYKIPCQKIGYYAVLISSDKDFKQGKVLYKFFQITDLITVTSRTIETAETTVKVLDRTTGLPVEGATVKALGEEYKGNKWVFNVYATKTSDKNGDCVFKKSDVSGYKGYNLNFTAEKGSDFLDRNRMYFSEASESSTNNYGKIFTDRALYRPGQTVNFKIVGYSKKDNNVQVLEGKKVTVAVRDINRQEIYKQELTLNEFGSADGKFDLPTSCVLGNYSFFISGLYGSHSFSVEEYKRPTFEIFTKDTESQVALNKEVTVSGNAVSYSGVKIQDAKVKYEVVRIPKFYGWWFFRYDLKEKSVAHGEVTTDENGEFKIKFLAKPDKTLPEDLNLVFTYKVKIDVTDINGETQSTTHYETVGYAGIFLSRILSSDLYFKGQDKFCDLKISAYNASYQPVECDVEITVRKLKNFANPLSDNDLYKLEEEKVLKTFTVKSSHKVDLQFLENLEDGNYSVTLKTKDAQNHEITSDSRFTVIAENCKNTAFNKYFWTQNRYPSREPGEKAKFIFGTSMKDVNCWYEVFCGDKRISTQQNFRLSQNAKTIEIPILEEYRGGISLRFFFVKDNRFYQQTYSVSVPFTNKKIDVKYETFRDKLEPGQTETIKLKIIDKKQKPVTAEMLAVLYDESLDAIRENHWSFSCYDYNSTCGAYEGHYFGLSSASVIKYNGTFSYYEQSYSPQINWFGHEIYSFGRPQEILYRQMAFGARSKSAVNMMVMEESAPMADAEVLDDKIEVADEEAPAEAMADLSAADEGGFDEVKVRENFSETAFFEPHLVTDADGNISIQFTMPESLTKWHFKSFTHTKDLKFTLSENHLITQKPFMVEPNLPRFFLERDKITIPVKISNLTEEKLAGKVKIEILDFQTQKPVSDYKIDATVKDFEVAADRSTTAEFTLEIPKRPEPVIVKIVGISDGHSDGSQKYVPVLTTRTLITESQTLYIRGNQTKNFMVNALKNQSQTQDNQSFTFEFTSNPAWLAFMSLPALRETDRECLDYIFDCLYANMLAKKIITSNPGFEKTYNSLSEEDFKSALEKNQELKSIMLNETPWLLDAKTEGEQMKKLAKLFNSKAVDETNAVYFKKLLDGQYSNGGWPWFKGMKESLFVTQEIVCGLGRLIHLGAVENTGDVSKMTKRGISFMDKKLKEDYDRLKKLLGKKELEKYHPSYYDIQYFYARSFFDEKVPSSSREAYDFFLSKLVQYWTDFSLYAQALLATTFQRLDKQSVAKDIIASLKDNAQNSDEFGMYYSKNLNGYHWYNSPIETQAMIIEAFSEFKMAHEVEELKIWLIKHKQTNSWKSTRATTEAVYALLMNGDKLSTDEQPCKVKIGSFTLEEKPSEGAAYVKKVFAANEIKPEFSDIEVVNPNKHIAFGATYLQYFEEYENVRATANGLTLTKEIYKITKDALGQDVATLVTPETPLKQGDKLKARFVITTDRDLEYVFLKDVHSSAFEPLNKLSGGRYQDGLYYYESTKDACEEFFIEFMQRGTYVFEYPLVAVHKGVLTNGIATIECMYAPEFRANSTSQKVKVE
ncbi:MAG: hypothetical protein II956_07380 [Bacteroidales bacterium]|nr:hypothetical protein [Bacteroidales bacterium]